MTDEGTSGLTPQEHQMFLLLEEAVMYDRRVPTQQQFLDMHVRDSRRQLDMLMAKGYIHLRNYGHNWRVVFMQHGQYDKGHSKMPPLHWREHKDSLARRGEL